MVNILSRTEKKKILIEYRFRLGVTAVLAIAGLVFANIILLTPSYYILKTKYNFVSNQVAMLERAHGGIDQEKEINNRTRELNKKISFIGAVGNENTQAPLPTILKIIDVKGTAIKITSIFYEKNGDRERVVVSGNAENRDSLALFLETLKKEPSFTKVELPIESYVKSTDINFSLTVESSLKTINPKKI